MEPLRKKWTEAKWKKLEYYIAKFSPECWVQCKTRRPILRIQTYLITTMSVNSHRALTLLCTRPHKLGIKIANSSKSVKYKCDIKILQI